jgi:putative RNA 2'-phosphotransferase
MDKHRRVKVSKFLSYVLRHHPESIGIKLDDQGWVSVSELLQEAQNNGFRITPSELDEVVEQNDKKRFSFSEDGFRIRANYGHSVVVDLGYIPVVPPDILYHGTARKSLRTIKDQGLTKVNRQYVHLSPDLETATNVGQRHGKPVVLKVESGRMHLDGYDFYLSSSGIWLTEFVPLEYLILPRST